MFFYFIWGTNFLMAEKRKKGRWGKLGIDTKSRSWLREEFPIKELSRN